MRRSIHILLQAIGWILDVIGIFGIPDDLAEASRLAERIRPYVESAAGRLSLLVVGTALLAIIYGRWLAHRWSRRPALPSKRSPPDEIAACQDDIVLTLAKDDEHVHKRIRDGGPSHAIRANITTKPYLHSALPVLHDISRWTAGKWNSLNSGNRMSLNWVGRGAKSYQPHDFAGPHKFVVLNYYDDERRLELPSDATLPSFVERKNLPHGRYKLEIEVEYIGGIACHDTFIVDWDGTIETLRIEKQTTQTQA